MSSLINVVTLQSFEIKTFFCNMTDGNDNRAALTGIKNLRGWKIL